LIAASADVSAFGGCSDTRMNVLKLIIALGGWGKTHMNFFISIIAPGVP
jgi:hypothetical protein